jgi:hypothetical protein
VSWSRIYDYLHFVSELSKDMSSTIIQPASRRPASQPPPADLRQQNGTSSRSLVNLGIPNSFERERGVYVYIY